LQYAEEVVGAALVPRQANPGAVRPFGPSPSVMLREDGEGAYPVVADIPILLAPEMLTPGDPPSFDLSAAQYAEAYAEREFYDEEAEKKHALLSAGEVGNWRSGRSRFWRLADDVPARWRAAGDRDQPDACRAALRSSRRSALRDRRADELRRRRRGGASGSRPNVSTRSTREGPSIT
jgi:hypothetical protein